MDASGLLKIVDSVLDDLLEEMDREKPSKPVITAHAVFCKNAIALADIKTAIEPDRALEKLARRRHNG